METPVEIAAFLAKQDEDKPQVVEEWGIFNDPDVLKPRMEAGEIHPLIYEELMKPLWTSPLAGPAKRYQEYYNLQRAENSKFMTEGWLILKMRTITQSPWRKIEKDEWEEIDDGKRANG